MTCHLPFRLVGCRAKTSLITTSPRVSKTTPISAPSRSKRNLVIGVINFLRKLAHRQNGGNFLIRVINFFAPAGLCVKINCARAISPRAGRQWQNLPLPGGGPERPARRPRRRTAGFSRAQTSHVPNRTSIAGGWGNLRLHAAEHFV